MPEDIFLNCLLFSQFAKKPFSTLEHSKQKEILDIMLGFNQYDIYQKKFSDTLKIYQEQTNIHNTKIPYIENNILNINNSIFELDKRYSEKSILLNNRILEINNEIFNDEEFYKNNIRILDELSKKEKILNNIQNLKSEKTERKNILTQQEESQINQLKDKFRTVLDKNISDEKLKIKDDLSSVDLEIQQVENKLLETKTQEKSELDKINFLKSEKISSLTLSHNMKINELKTNYDNIKQSINFNQSNYKKLNTNILELHSKIEKIDNFLKKDIPLCYTCGQEIKNNEIDKIQEEKSIIESQISSNKLELKNIEEEFFTLSKTLLNIEKKETKEIEIFKKLTSEIQTQFKNQIELNNEK
jgi:chromosome segregation ATPase